MIYVWKMIVISTNMVAHNRHFVTYITIGKCKWNEVMAYSIMPFGNLVFLAKSHIKVTLIPFVDKKNSFPHKTFTKFCPISKTDNSPLKNDGSKGKYKYLHTWVKYLGSHTSSTELFSIWGICSVFIRNFCLWPKWQSSTRRYRKSYHHP